MKINVIQNNNNYNNNFKGTMIIKNYKNGNLTNLKLPYDKDVSLVKSIKKSISNSLTTLSSGHTQHASLELPDEIQTYIDELKKIGINIPKSNNKECFVDFNTKFDGIYQNIDYSINAGTYKIVHTLKSWHMIVV